MENYMKLEIPSKSCNEAFVRAVISAFAVQLDITVEEMADIKTAVSEAVTNAIVHAYSDFLGTIKIICRVIGNEIEICVEDFGKGISDVKQAMQPLYTENPDGERSGMGFTVMQTFMDALEVKSAVNTGTLVIMRKVIGR